MGKTEYITVGKSTFRVEVLKDLTQKDALKQFHYLAIYFIYHLILKD